jgi:chemotaxis protein methyltransferase WspC
MDAPATPPPVPAVAPALDDIRAAVEHGLFAEAATLCEEHVRLLGPSAEAFCLLGVVREAAGQPEQAAINFRKALYLDPEHADAVTRLALLVERQGQAAEAKVLWSRARRLAAGGVA